jgi:hypothetical protein
MRIKVLASIVAFCFILGGLIVVITVGPATRYEVSIYNAYPPLFWFLLISSYLIGLFLLVHYALSQEYNRSWLNGLVIVLVSTAIVFLLPLFRGYFLLGMMDPLRQLGLIKDILLTGHFQGPWKVEENFYPSWHILVSTLSLIVGGSVEIIMLLFPTIIFIFYTIFTYLLSRELVGSRSAILVTALCILPLYTSVSGESFPYFVPRRLTYLLLPFVLYLLIKGRSKKRYNLLSLLMSLVLPTFHPADGGLFLVEILIILNLSYFTYQQLTKWRPELKASNTSTRWKDLWKMAIVLFISWFCWFSSYRGFDLTINGLYDSLIRGLYAPEFNIYVSWVERAGMSLRDLIWETLKKTGHQLWFLFLTVVATLVVLKRFNTVSSEERPMLVAFFCLFVFITTITISNFLWGVGWLGYTRLIPYIIFSATFLNGLCLYKIFRSKRGKAVIVFSFLLPSAILGILNVYPSPFNSGEVGHVTMADKQEIIFLLQYRDESLLLEQVHFNQLGMAQAILGASAWPTNFRVWTEIEGKTTPEHFGYLENKFFGECYRDDMYFLSHTGSLLTYTERIPNYKKAWRWTPEDFTRLENDPTVSLVYCNGESKIHYILGIKK